MLKIDSLNGVLEKICPLELSYKMIERGGYDNSGVIVRNHDEINKILFSLDLSSEVVSKAKELGCDTIITHHPAIYAPIKSLSILDQTAPLLNAIKLDLNVISMHLNLDIAQGGIDQSLASAFGGENNKILDLVDSVNGYGREFEFGQDFSLVINTVIEELATDKGVFYGKGLSKKIATFCGSGGSCALESVEKGLTDADTIITSDIQHHQLKELIEKGKKVVIIPHYVSEDYGFYKFYERVKNSIKDQVEFYYFRDKRFV